MTDYSSHANAILGLAIEDRNLDPSSSERIGAAAAIVQAEALKDIAKSIDKLREEIAKRND